MFLEPIFSLFHGILISFFLLLFQSLYQDAGVRVDGYMGSSNPSGGFTAVDVAVCTIEKANSLINRLLEDQSINKLGSNVTVKFPYLKS